MSFVHGIVQNDPRDGNVLHTVDAHCELSVQAQRNPRFVGSLHGPPSPALASSLASGAGGRLPSRSAEGSQAP